jgi:uncharacterized protein (TIGR02118 family)
MRKPSHDGGVVSKDSYAVLFGEHTNESPAERGERTRAIAADLARNAEADSVVLFVADGHPESLVQPTLEAPVPASFRALLNVTGAPREALPPGDVVYRVRSRVIKPRPRGTDGERTPGFTMVVPIVRGSHLSHEQFDAHWRDRHAPLHVRHSPATERYEQVTIDAPVSGSGQPWDGIGLLSFASMQAFDEELFADADAQRTLLDDAASFSDASRTETLFVSEYTYRSGEL